MKMIVYNKIRGAGCNNRTLCQITELHIVSVQHLKTKMKVRFVSDDFGKLG